jgi:hypothetical protein
LDERKVCLSGLFFLIVDEAVDPFFGFPFDGLHGTAAIDDKGDIGQLIVHDWAFRG